MKPPFFSASATGGVLGPADLRANPAQRWRLPLDIKKLSAGDVLPGPLAWSNDVAPLLQAAAAQQVAPCRILVVYEVVDIADCRSFLSDLAAQQVAGEITLLLCAADQENAASDLLSQSGILGRVVPGRMVEQPGQKAISLALQEADFVALLTGRLRFDPLLLGRALPLAQMCPHMIQAVEQLVDPRPGTTPFAVQRALRVHWPDYDYRAVSGLNLLMSAPFLRALGGLPSGITDPALVARVLACRALRSGAYFSALLVSKLARRMDVPQEAELARVHALCPELRKKDGGFASPKLSVLIPGQGATPAQIDAVVGNVLRQDLVDLEICILLPGAVTADLQQRYATVPQVRLLTHVPTQVWEHSITQARGMYVMGLRSDDCLLPGALRRMVKALDTCPKVAFCAGDGERLDGQGRFVAELRGPRPLSHHRILQADGPPPVFMLRRQCWARTRAANAGPERALHVAEYDLCLRLAETGRMVGLRDVLVQRRGPMPDVPVSARGAIRAAALRRLGLERDWQVVQDGTDAGEAVRRAGRPRVLFWPDFSRANPYQALLYQKARHSHEIFAAPIEAAVKMQEQACVLDHSTPLTFHLHWISFLFQNVSGRGQARLRIRAFLTSLTRFKQLGGRIIWTVHNTLSHDSRFADLERDLSERIVALADVVHVHSAASVVEVRDEFDMPRHKIRISRHGHYLGVYDDFISRDGARQILGIEADETVILFLGQVRAYKGVDQLVQSFRKILRETPKARLVIAGVIHGAFWRTVVPALSPEERSRILAPGRFLDAAEMQIFFRAADVTVFPYRNILTSGSLLLALSFGLPVVVPDVGMTRDVLQGSQAGFLYDKSAPDGVHNALKTALSAVQTGQAAALQAAARTLAHSLSWPNAADTFFDAPLPPV